MQVKYSRQREAILHFLEGRDDHPTADVIYAHLRNRDPRLSLGTVYRNLALLTDLGKIQCFAAGDGRVHYDPSTAPHSHLICRSCGAVVDVRTVCPDAVVAQAQAASGGTIEKAQVFFYGLCGKCAAQDGTEQLENASADAFSNKSQ